jgi:isoquinoline 1-oxidoreductase subunit beta
LQEELTLTNGVIDQENCDSYTSLRLNQMPKVEVDWVESDAASTGVGELGLPPVGPAVGNVIYQAIKKRQRVLPLSKGMFECAFRKLSASTRMLTVLLIHKSINDTD